MRAPSKTSASQCAWTVNNRDTAFQQGMKNSPPRARMTNNL